MASKLPPSQAAKLADDVYVVNTGVAASVRGFMNNKAFTNDKSKKVALSADVGGRVFLKTQDSFGICSLGGSNFKDDAFIVFRGTTTANNKADWITDASCGLTRGKSGHLVHVGFNQTFNSMLPNLESFFTKNSVKGTVHVIGHSLGGAVAALAADWIKRKKSKSVMLYTFGAPRVGTHFFAKSTTETIGIDNMYRVHHKTDPVPMVALFPFTQAPHNSYGHFVDSSELVVSGAAHSMVKYKKTTHMYSSWDGLKGTPAQAYGLEYGIKQWLESKSWTTTESPNFFRWAEAATQYVIRKVLLSLGIGAQAIGMGVSTMADQLAYTLAKGVELAEHISIWVEHLMRRLMQALGMAVAKSKELLTRGLIRTVLARLNKLNTENARRAINRL